MTVLRQMLADFRAGRTQRMLSGATAAVALPLGLEIYLEHYAGSFGNKWMWTPVALSPALTAAGVAGVRSERVARTVLPAIAAVYAVDGFGGLYFHLRGIARKPGGFKEPTYNVVMGPPLLAPGALALVGAMGLAAGLARRER